MKKIIALDFLHNKKFGVDLLSANGDLICSANQEVTPEKLLELYFKDIYINEILPERVQEENITVNTSEETVVVEQEEEKIGFDEELANRIVKHSLELASIIGMTDEVKNDLEKAAYYHNVGNAQMYKSELLKPGFKSKRADISYSYIIKELDLPQHIAEVSKLYYRNYDPNQFGLDIKSKKNIPIHQIVSVASYYEEFLAQTGSKEEALMKLIRLGGNKFNVFVLHKFVHKVRNSNV